MLEVEFAASVIPSQWFPGKGLFSVNDVHTRGDAEFVSKDYFNIFRKQFIEGDKNQLFADPNNLAISEELAMKLFGTSQGIVGNTIEWNQKDFTGTYTIKGVFLQILLKTLPYSLTQFLIMRSFFKKIRNCSNGPTMTRAHTFFLNLIQTPKPLMQKLPVL